MEWDGLARLCFTRKNKTLGAIFRQAKVLAVLEENYRRLAEIEKFPVPEDFDIKDHVNNVLESAK